MTQATPSPAIYTRTEFARLFQVTRPTVDDLKSMALLEASGTGFYTALADAAPNEAIRGLLVKNGREETAHAHRLKKAIMLMANEDYPLPPAEQNPFHDPDPKVTVSRESLTGLAAGEGTGEDLYETWASNIGNDEVAALLRLNGKEETGHQQRLLQAIELFDQ
jgi:rubrerythrin